MTTRGGQSANIILPGTGRTRRVTRRPAHNFYLKQIPFCIQPFMIAPVLPGETMKNFMFQARVVTDPLANPIIGWWSEFYFFYVKLRDLDDRDQISNSFIDPGVTLTSLKDTADMAELYFNPTTGSQINWVKMCLKRVTEEYFRDQSETWNSNMIGNLPLAKLVGNSWLDSFINDDSFQTAIEPTVDTSGATIGISVIEAAMDNWDRLKLGNMTDMTFEDYCATYGVKLNQSDDELHKPELLRFVRAWQYPSNTINPSTGAPTSAVSWSHAERADKDRFFKEPGFIFGVSVIRPKCYLSGQKSFAATILDDFYAWLPATERKDPRTSLKQFTAGAGGGGPLPGVTDDHWVDVQDLFLYGGQFLNVDPTTAAMNSIALPTAGGFWKYPTNQAMVDVFFASANATCKVYGVCHLNILGSLQDRT